MTDQPWPSDWLRGFLSLAVLRIVSTGPTYGYAIATSLEEGGFGRLKGGTLYPLLGRLENAGFLSTTWAEGDGGPGRKYFELTEAGRLQLEEESRHWDAFTQATRAFLGSPSPAASDPGGSHD